MSQSSNTQTIERILIVDTDSMLCELLQYRMENEGFKVDISHSAEEALTHDLTDYALLLVDLMGSEYDGMRFVRLLRQRPETYNMPIIMMSMVASEDDIVAGLDNGADDYLAKPLSTRELVARIKSVLRRRRAMSQRRMSNVLRFEGLQLDLGTGAVSVNGEQVSLSHTELLLLAMFLRHRNHFFERSEIHNEICDDDNELSPAAINTNISRLRKKIGEYGRHIINRQGYGYGFVD